MIGPGSRTSAIPRPRWRDALSLISAYGQAAEPTGRVDPRTRSPSGRWTCPEAAAAERGRTGRPALRVRLVDRRDGAGGLRRLRPAGKAWVRARQQHRADRGLIGSRARGGRAADRRNTARHRRVRPVVVHRCPAGEPVLPGHRDDHGQQHEPEGDDVRSAADPSARAARRPEDRERDRFLNLEALRA